MKNLKTAIVLATALLCTNLSCESKKSSQKNEVQKVQLDTTKPDEPKFFGYTAEELVAIPIEDIKTMIDEGKFTVDEYQNTFIKAEIFLIKEETKKDSIATMKHYEEIEKMLGVK